jgi:hypothetical protein
MRHARAILVLIAVAVSACGVGRGSPGSSPTMTPASSNSAAPSATAETSGVAHASVAAYPPVVSNPVGILPPASIARVVVTGLRVRAGHPGVPEYDDVVYKLSAGDLVLIDSLPWAYLPPEASSDGRGWYAVHVGGASIDSYMDGGINGWVAEGDGGLEWLAAEPVTCLGPATLALLLAPPGQDDRWTTAWERLACHGNEQLELEGVAEAPCFEGVESPYTFDPFFLAGPDMCSAIVVDDIDADGNHSALALDLRYREDVAWPPRGDLLRVSGHFDDPASTTCNAVSNFGPSLLDTEFLVLFCRERFVVDAHTVIGHRDLAPQPWEE